MLPQHILEEFHTVIMVLYLIEILVFFFFQGELKCRQAVSS